MVFASCSFMWLIRKRKFYCLRNRFKHQIWGTKIKIRLQLRAKDSAVISYFFVQMGTFFVEWIIYKNKIRNEFWRWTMIIIWYVSTNSSQCSPVLLMSHVFSCGNTCMKFYISTWCFLFVALLECISKNCDLLMLKIYLVFILQMRVFILSKMCLQKANINENRRSIYFAANIFKKWSVFRNMKFFF